MRSHPRPGSNSNGNLVAPALIKRYGKGTDSDATDALLVAAPLSHGSNPNSNAAGRRREDDENLVAYGPNTNRGGNADMCLEEGIAPPITGSHGNPGGVLQVDPYTFDWQAGGGGNDESFRGKSRAWIDDKPGCARALVKNKTLAVHTQTSVRRLTPTECERLQGFPDGWTDLGGTADSPRYAALGDAVTVPVAEWIAGRIAGREAEDTSPHKERRSSEGA